MDYIQLGKSDLSVSRLAFGCLALGGHGVGEVDYKELRLTFEEALNKGINFFDTSDIYGIGHSETLLGEWLVGRRDKYIISTKFGVRKTSEGKIVYDNSIEWLNEALEGSLKRLRTDYIDLYFLHHYDDKTPLDKIFIELEKHRKSGRIRYYGISNLSFSSVKEFVNNFPGLIAQQNEYSLINRTNEQDSVEFEANGISLTAYGCLGQGILSGKYDHNSIFNENDARVNPKYVNFHGEKLDKNLQFLEKISDFTKKYKIHTSQLAIRWVLDNFKSSVSLLGVKNRNQLEQLVKTCDFFIPPEDLIHLERLSRLYQ